MSSRGDGAGAGHVGVTRESKHGTAHNQTDNIGRTLLVVGVQGKVLGGAILVCSLAHAIVHMLTLHASQIDDVHGVFVLCSVAKHEVVWLDVTVHVLFRVDGLKDTQLGRDAITSYGRGEKMK